MKRIIKHKNNQLKNLKQNNNIKSKNNYIKENLYKKRKNHINNTKEEFFVFSPMNNNMSEKNRKADTVQNNQINNENKNKNTKEFHKSELNNVIEKITNIIDKYLTDDIVILALIAILFSERFKLKKAGANKNELDDYDLMLAMLIYLFI